jgi:DNA polymerase-3 subunit chi
MKAPPKHPLITFYSVSDTTSKASRICATVQHHFLQGERVLIAVASQEAALYIDQLLWRMPPESFLPHAIANVPSEERVVINMSGQNVNQATVLWNLSPGPAHSLEGFKTLYELWDQTHPQKLALSETRYQSYLQGGYHVHRE